MAAGNRSAFSGVTLSWAEASECGPFRRANEDSVLAVPGCYVVADGMGGYRGGALASQMVVESIESMLSAAPAQLGAATRRASAVNAALSEAQQGIETMAAGQMMGTTVTGVVLCEDEEGPQWLVWHVGDSRLYRLFGEGLAQVTVDHTVVNEMVISGDLAPAEVANHPDRHIITRAVGTPDSLPADFATLEVRAGEILLLCTDGLSGTASPASIERILSATPDPEEAAKLLVELAYESGSRDNVTVVVIHCDEVAGDMDHQLDADAEITRPRGTAGVLDTPATAAEVASPDDIKDLVKVDTEALIKEVPR